MAFAWTPTPEQLRDANVTRLAATLGCGDYESLHRLSVEDPDRFWRAVVADNRLPMAPERRLRSAPVGPAGGGRRLPDGDVPGLSATRAPTHRDCGWRS